MSVIGVMTFNIFGQPGDFDNQYRSQSEREKPEGNWAKRGALTLRTIRRYAPDLIGLQEVQPGHFEFYRDGLTDYGSELGLEYDAGINAQFSSIFWKRERFELTASGKFYFSPTPHVGSSAWGVSYPMGATWVQLRDRRNGAELVHLNTHFEDGVDGERSRVESSRVIVLHVLEHFPELPVVATGDFNCNPGSAAYDNFTQNGFVDTYLAAGNQDRAASSFHGFLGEAYDARDPMFGGPDADPFWRIDWILTRDARQKLKIITCTIVRDAELPLYPSDHYPVLAEPTLSTEEAR